MLFVSKLSILVGACVFAAASSLAPEPVKGTPRFIVVVNEANTWKGSHAEGVALVKALFRKDKMHWTSGVKARVFDRPSSEKAHGAFVKQVLQMTEKSLTAHWLKRKQTKGDSAPRTIRSRRMLLKMVARFKGAMGFLERPKGKLPKKVRVLFGF